MPYGIRKSKKGYKVIKKTTGKALPGTSKTKKMAKRRIRAIGASSHSEIRF